MLTTEEKNIESKAFTTFYKLLENTSYEPTQKDLKRFDLTHNECNILRYDSEMLKQGVRIRTNSYIQGKEKPVVFIEDHGKYYEMG